MSASVFESPWLSGLFGDDAMAAILSPERHLQHMLAFEAACWVRGRLVVGVNADLSRGAPSIS